MKDKTAQILTQPKVLQTLSNIPSAVIPLSAVSKYFNGLFSKKRSSYLSHLKDLLSHAALGEWFRAENIWRGFPDLLTCRGTIFHPNRLYSSESYMTIAMDKHPGCYRYNHTAWQIALMNQEYKIANTMAAYMKEDEKQKQFAEIFPDGEINCTRFNVEKCLSLLENLFAVLFRDDTTKDDNVFDMNIDTQTALNELYNHVKPEAEHKTGLVFDAHIYLKAKALFDEKGTQLKNAGQRFIWSVRVEEYLASLMETVFLRHHAQGLENKVTTLGCTLSTETSIFPFRRKDIPGFDFFVRYGKHRNKAEHRRQGPPDMPLWLELYESTRQNMLLTRGQYQTSPDTELSGLLSMSPGGFIYGQ